MALKLNKTIKTHIADMAIRSKYQAEYNELMQALKTALYDHFYLKFNNDDFNGLPERAMKHVKKTSSVYLSSEKIQMSKIEKRHIERGYGLDVAFQTRSLIDCIYMDDLVFGEDYRFHIADAARVEIKSLKSFLKATAETRDILLESMSSYRTANHMMNEMPWTKEFYPESEKKPSVDIVPLATISKANMIMGNNDEN